MVYTCQFCGAWFPSDLLKEVIDKNKKTLDCPYCNITNDLERIKTSHVAKGYDRLEYGDFLNAEMEFGEALKNGSASGTVSDSACLDSYLGRALAQYAVQVIYEEEIADPKTDPVINCYVCNERFLEDSADYQKALKIAHSIADSDQRALAVERIDRFARKVDGIKRVYERRAASGEYYDLFLAYDDTDTSENGLKVANGVRAELPEYINRVYIQDPNGLSFEQYEGELLYALHNTKCMLVMVGGPPSSRQLNLYSRYYRAKSMSNDENKSIQLGFVYYKDAVQIHLPDHQISRNIFSEKDIDGYSRFVSAANRYTYAPRHKHEAELPPAPPPPPPPPPGTPVLNQKRCFFGSYPQKQVKDAEILAIFQGEPKPSMLNPGDWTPMLYSKNGKPYTWYKDKDIDGKKYRAIFFLKYRQVFSVRQSNIVETLQQGASFLPGRIYVFAYSNIEWNVLDISRDTATLVASMGLDCGEFNNRELSPNWEDSSIRKWLNETFYQTAFSDVEKQHLWKNSRDEHVTIPDKSLIIEPIYREQFNSYNIAGSDYFRCLGGACDRNVSNFWIKAESEKADLASTVQPHNVTNIVMQCVDASTVSIIPVICVAIGD